VDAEIGQPSPALVDQPPTEAPATPPGKRRRLSPGTRNTIEWIVVIGGAVLITILLRTFAFQTFYIPSESMVPTLQVGDRIVVNKIADDYDRGNIVVFNKPDSWQAAHAVLIKRIVGLPGETIEIRDNTVFIDGEELVEPYLAEGATMADYGPFVIPDEQVFVMGDNRTFSSDSRENGPVPLSDVVGRAALRVWPLGTFGRL